MAGPQQPNAGGAHEHLGRLLVQEKLVTEQQLADAQAVRAKEGGFLGQILVQQKAVRQEDISHVLVKHCKVPHISLLDYDISTDILGLVPQEVCMEFGLIPIDKMGRILTVAMVDPLDDEALAMVQERCPELRIKPILCNWAHFEQVSARFFGRKEEKKSSEVSVASFGLSARPAAAAIPDDLPVAEEAVPEPAPAARSAGAPFPAPVNDGAVGEAVSRAIERGLALGLQQMAAVLKTELNQRTGLGAEVLTGIREGMVEGFQSLAEQQARMLAARPASVEPGLGAPVLDRSAIEASLRHAMQENTRELIAGIQQLQQGMAVGGAPSASAALDLEQFAAIIRESVGGAMQEGLGGMIAQLRAHAGAEQGTPSLTALSDMIRDGVGGVMQEAIATLAVQLRSHGRSGGDEHNPAIERLASFVEATLQSVQQTQQMMEIQMVKQGQMPELHSSGRARHSSVSAFGASDADVAAAFREEDRGVLSALESEHPLEALTFDNYVPGDANAFTHKLGQAVARKPGSEYNPFFLFGSVGIGKTHLVSAMGNGIRSAHKHLRVGYVSASHFSRRLHEAVKEDAQTQFRENYSHWDVLILDDIQFLAGRLEAQEEFFHIFNALHERGRQIIIASDKAPDRLGLLEPRLVSRFSSGIVAELRVPEYEARLAILRNHAAGSKTKLAEEILALLAMKVSQDVRKMVGSYRKILAYAELEQGALTMERATEILSHIGSEAAA
ncbi:MAG: ATP-binding protein [Candidatus Hydrogenedentes bacterium]|nr:ATP-binding protein [Candidatus Hydrogenedentota bacterium]